MIKNLPYNKYSNPNEQRRIPDNNYLVGRSELSEENSFDNLMGD